jgi:cathepsin B
LVILLVASTSASIIDRINSQNVGWVAGENAFFAGQSEEDIIPLLGAKLNNPNRPPVYRAKNVANPPAQFDSRTQWPGCIGAVRNQGSCGSCWAFGCVEALSDRFCIASGGKYNVTLGALDPVTCDEDDSGCEGGFPEDCWSYAVHTGIVTEECAPYNDSIPTCPPEDQPCLKFVPTPKCPRACSDGSSWTSSKHFGKTVYSVSRNVADIENEIFTNGPVEASFTVYADFPNYKSGVYKHVTGRELGGHAVKMIGWGVLNGTDYWLIENSWTTSWGADGYFMILKGVDECGIESGIVAGLPNIPGF